MRIPVLWFLAVAGTLAAGSFTAQPASTTPGIAAAAEQAAEAAQPAPDNALRVRLSPAPGLRAGDRFRIDLKGLFQFDVRGVHLGAG